ncbi:LysR family transcriptional regulator [Cupriavidus sp. USMAA2-4]|uniref:LysR family transcriptional regulator n=1 Tax=Cupriavidus malaysiensis TaxID=367825 RepID=A0ABN4TX66_9BURK|nr:MULTISPECIES: LysR family transcriptional regulator [Cupriavidus]AOY94336.1 LysR family transcriptional regulator [Cupriavidus sp. USMAA2-4]AOZ02749.1 LysR family transcriptional regulator [Cupriavidus sp. USMAHM13]AOZ09878.1 LysR family transcriptional regulator [Cupriavidus malaysiensis]
MYSLDDLKLFVRTAELENLSAAARELDRTAATASAALIRLEQRLNARLFARTTRRMRLTEEGRLFLDAARRALAALEEGEGALAEQREELAGPLRLSAPSDLGRSWLRGWLDDFLETHPQLSLELSIGDTLADLFRSNVDLAVRVGWLEDSSLVRRQLTTTRRVAVAAPSYLARAGRPASPEQLARHQLLCLAPGGQARMRWRFQSGSQQVEVEASGRRTSDDGAVVRDWALGGHGIAFKSWFDVAADIRDGRLELLLRDWYGQALPLQLVFLRNRFPAYRQRRLIEFLEARFAAFDAAYPFPA